MSKMSKSSQGYFLNFLGHLREVVDEKNPGRKWIQDGYDCFCEFNEMCMNFMSPCEQIMTWRILGDKQRESLKILYEKINEYDDNNTGKRKTNNEIRVDPSWIKIREHAKSIYAELEAWFKRYSD